MVRCVVVCGGICVALILALSIGIPTLIRIATPQYKCSGTFGKNIALTARTASKITGEGTCIAESWKVFEQQYTGGLLNGKRHGDGEHRTSMLVHKGKFNNDVREGEGKTLFAENYVRANGSLAGIWKNDLLDCESAEFTLSEPHIAYKGQARGNTMHGSGTLEVPLKLTTGDKVVRFDVTVKHGEFQTLNCNLTVFAMDSTNRFVVEKIYNTTIEKQQIVADKEPKIVLTARLSSVIDNRSEEEKATDSKLQQLAESMVSQSSDSNTTTVQKNEIDDQLFRFLWDGYVIIDLDEASRANKTESREVKDDTDAPPATHILLQRQLQELMMDIRAFEVYWHINTIILKRELAPLLIPTQKATSNKNPHKKDEL